MEHALMCPQCNAPLTPTRFAASVTCSYCGAVVKLDEAAIPADRFHEAFRVWNSPAAAGTASWLTLGGRFWTCEKLLGQGEVSDVYFGRLARWPTELVILKVQRAGKESAALKNEWRILSLLQQSEAPGADFFTVIIPQPVVQGEVKEGAFAGRQVNIFRWAGGFRHTLADVRRVYPQGINPRISIWVWRRILEMLSFLHASNVVHGAVLPEYLLVHESEHGIRLVGYGNAGQPGQKWLPPSTEHEGIFPKASLSREKTLKPELDLFMSARCMIYLLGGNPEKVVLPAQVPGPLADVIRRVAQINPDRSADLDAWALRDKLGQIAKQVYGASRFLPIEMPD